eukprot:gene12086-8637_t
MANAGYDMCNKRFGKLRSRSGASTAAATIFAAGPLTFLRVARRWRCKSQPHCLFAMFSTLFSFENSTHRLVEVVREDIETDDKSRKYFWLLVELSSLAITRLEFQSMTGELDGWQARGFTQGALRFSASEAVFGDDEQRFVASADKASFDTSVRAAIESFLSSQ